MTRLSEIRGEHKLTQMDVAKAIGITAGSYANVESGARLPSLPVALRLVEALHLEPVTALELLRELAGLPAEPTPAEPPTDPRQAALPIRSAA